MNKSFLSALLLAATVATPTFAQQADSAPPSMPAMSGPLSPNDKPLSFDVGSAGKVYVGGAVTGIGIFQTNETATDDETLGDISNGQIFVQKTDGLVQFYLQAGTYSIPSLGTAYVHAEDATDEFFGPLPQAYVKLAPTDEFSLMVGKLPTLIGSEYTFTFQNMNIARGLLWNQENAVNRGVQGNYALGPLALSISFNDGFYSNQYSWLTGAATYSFDNGNSLYAYAGGNLGNDTKSTLATPLAQNNSNIYGLSYTHNMGNWTLNPYVQYTEVPTDVSVGILDEASTLGGAVLAKYKVNDHISLAGRAEYIESDSDSAASPNLLYGNDSGAWSLTFTPTYQQDAFFVRGEASYTEAVDAASGLAFGPRGNDKSQARFILETGILF